MTVGLGDDEFGNFLLFYPDKVGNDEGFAESKRGGMAQAVGKSLIIHTHILCEVRPLDACSVENLVEGLYQPGFDQGLYSSILFFSNLPRHFNTAY